MTNSLVPASLAEHYQPYSLTVEQRLYQQALTKTRPLLADIAQAMETELSRLFHDLDFGLELNLVEGTALEQWLREPGRLLLHCPVLVPEDSQCMVAMDFQSVHQLADLSLGGQLDREPAQSPLQRSELTPSELRVCGRLAQRQLQAIQQVLFGERSALPVTPTRHEEAPALYQFLPYKVRLLLNQHSVSWFIWLPVSFFVTDTLAEQHSNVAAVMLDKWPQVPVSGKVEMARRKVSLKQLQDFLNGAVLPIELNSTALWQLDKMSLFGGKVAEEAGKLVFQISEQCEQE